MREALSHANWSTCYFSYQEFRGQIYAIKNFGAYTFDSKNLGDMILIAKILLEMCFS